MGRKKKPMPKGTQQGRALSPVKREQIRQTFMLTGNKQETARLCAVSLKSVYNVLNEAEDPEVTRNRAKVAQDLATKVHVKADQVLDRITADDFQSGYMRDEDGQYVFDRQGRPIWLGPTLNQKVVSAAILIDKLSVLEDYKQKLDDTRGNAVLPTPESVSALVSGIQGKLKKLRLIDVEFESSEQSKKAEELLQKAQAEIDNAQEAEFETIDFDNPGGG